jgi:hypothetical protein
MIKSPVEVIGDNALNAADAVVWPVPPLAIGKPFTKSMSAFGNVTVRLAVRVVGVMVAE